MDENQTKRVSRREVVKLGGIAAALGAGLGVADAAGAGQDPAMMQLKFYTPPDRAGKQELLFAVRVPPPVQKRFMAAGQFQLKVEIEPLGKALPAVQRPAILGAAMVQIKGELTKGPGLLQHKGIK